MCTECESPVYENYSKCKKHLEYNLILKRGLRRLHKEKGLCSYCNNKKHGKLSLCEGCHRRMIDRKNKEHKEKIEKGECFNCKNKTFLNTKYCKQHYFYFLKRNIDYNNSRKEYLKLLHAKQREKYKSEKRCPSCSKKLDNDADKGFILCINCRLRCFKPRGWRYLNALNHENSTARL